MNYLQSVKLIICLPSVWKFRLNVHFYKINVQIEGSTSSEATVHNSFLWSQNKWISKKSFPISIYPCQNVFAVTSNKRDK